MLHLEVLCAHGDTTENISSSQTAAGAQTNCTEFNTHFLACMGSQVSRM